MFGGEIDRGSGARIENCARGKVLGHGDKLCGLIRGLRQTGEVLLYGFRIQIKFFAFLISQLENGIKISKFDFVFGELVYT